MNDNQKNEKRKKMVDKHNLNSFYYKFGYKYVEFNFENPTGEEYLLFVWVAVFWLSVWQVQLIFIFIY